MSKSIKAWSIIRKDGVLIPELTFSTREHARKLLIKTLGERVVPVEIKVTRR